MKCQHPFEKALEVSAEESVIKLTGQPSLAWADFLLNPRKLRGSDFLMRWSQGVWTEHLVRTAIHKTGAYFAIPYGPSGTAPHGVREFELYFEKLEHAGLGKIKRPDLLIFRHSDQNTIEKAIREIGGEAELPFTKENDSRMKKLLSLAVLAVECENSLWKAQLMPDYRTPLSPQKRLEGKLGLKKNAVVPTIIVKEEDRKPLLDWQTKNGVPIHIWHVFFDLGYGLSLNRLEELIDQKLILPTDQTFQNPSGPTQKKIIYKTYYQYGYPLVETTAAPELKAQFIVDKNGHILPYVKFEGGALTLRGEAIQVLGDLVKQRKLKK